MSDARSPRIGWDIPAIRSPLPLLPLATALVLGLSALVAAAASVVAIGRAVLASAAFGLVPSDQLTVRRSVRCTALGATTAAVLVLVDRSVTSGSRLLLPGHAAHDYRPPMPDYDGGC